MYRSYRTMRLFLVFAFAAVAVLAAPPVFEALHQQLSTNDFPAPNAPAMQHEPPANYNVKCETNVGSFVIEVHTAWAPIGSKRFYNLVVNNYFSFNYFFRCVKNFVVQFGLSGVPAVDSMYEVADINDDPVKMSNKEGFVTFATAGPNTRTTQLFINLGDNSFLDKQGFSPFGKINEEGMKVVQSINFEYAEQPDQNKIIQEGNNYLYKQFPRLSYIKSCHVEN